MTGYSVATTFEASDEDGAQSLLILDKDGRGGQWPSLRGWNAAARAQDWHGSTRNSASLDRAARAISPRENQTIPGGHVMLHELSLSQMRNKGKANRQKIEGIGDLIRAAREKALLTQDELSERAGLSASTVAQWERRTNRNLPTLQNLEKVCLVMGITIADLFISRSDGDPALTDIEDEVLYLLRKLDREQQRSFLKTLRSAVG